MKLHLVDLDVVLVEQWRRAFRDHSEVTITAGDILAQTQVGALVSPANGLGFMDGGIDACYRDYFGPRIERRVQAAIGLRPDGLLPVGASILIATDDSRFPYLIVAPTMTMPERVPPSHAYRAMRAALRVVAEHWNRIERVYCPGLCTGVGGVPPDMAAAEMAAAYRDWKKP